MGVGPAEGEWEERRDEPRCGFTFCVRAAEQVKHSVTHIISAYSCESGLKYGAVTGDLLGSPRGARRF